ncbi:MarR family transcriptional regulator [Phaeobacter sp.]|uniref:MarR family winged helix-turn-helix transcriptional regulator n=1 Tax=Phaeobacter sp. TaxID=1902409 RepID=UPI0025D96469|nr:MarR family transcriptional regulator [Phaeobacter sp.]
MSKPEFDMFQLPGYLIRRLHQISVSLFAERMSQHDLDLTPVQFATLNALALESGVDQATVASRISYDRATLGKVIDRLEAKGLIERTVSAQDRRARIVSLSQAGASLLGRAGPVVMAMQAEILPGLSLAEREQLVSLMTKAIGERSSAS